MRMEPDSDKFWYVKSVDLDVEIQVKIGNLDGKRERPSYEALLKDSLLRYSGLYQPGCSDLYVTCQVLCEGRELTLPVRTSYKAFSSRWCWNEWLTLPIKFSDLPRNAVLALTIYDTYGPRRTEPVGGTTISFFGKQGVFRQGLHDLRVWPGSVADEVLTPGKVQDHGKDQMQRLAKLAKKHRNGHMMKVDWLDRLTFREIELINEREKRSSNSMYLMIEFPRVEHEGVIYSIIWWERGGEVEYKHRTSGNMVRMPDPEIALENLQEAKHHRLARSLRSGVTDRDLKPNSAIRDSLHKIMGYPPTKQLTSDEQDSVWKYRFYLSSQKRALTKFLKCVNWKLSGEAKQAIDLLGRWAPPDADDALELLGPGFTYPDVRRYAVERLSHASDEDLQLYLLQLVQALRYEALDSIDMSLCDVSHYSSSSDVSADMCLTPGESPQLGDDPVCPPPPPPPPPPPNPSTPSLIMPQDPSSPSSPDESEAATIQQSDSSSLLADTEAPDTLATSGDSALLKEVQDTKLDLATFLIQRATRNPTLANYLYWYLLVECEDQQPGIKHDTKVAEMYQWVLRRFKLSLQQGNKEARATRLSLTRQTHFVDELVSLVKVVQKEGNRVRRIEKLQALLADPNAFKINFSSFEPMTLPLDPEVTVIGIIPEKATLFKSALEPLRLTFISQDGGEYVTIFKYGDDLRQDQLIIQIITLMDRLLRRENLDLRLTPYKVLATGTKHGFVQFVESSSVAEILRTEGSILAFLRKHSPASPSSASSSSGGSSTSSSPPGGIVSPEASEAYVRSCAGYCVITYLLGVGDRHGDNLLVSPMGPLFHIDFGYILGRDPKPLPPPLRLSREMVEGMGGPQSASYHEFRKLCYTAFHQLRRHASLVLNLFALMVDASVPDIALEPDKTLKKVEAKFRLDLDDEEAAAFLQTLLDQALGALVAAVVDQIHKFAQYMRK